MRIHDITLTEFHGIHDMHIDFGGQSAIIFGVNGVGKSPLLRAIEIIYSKALKKLLLQRNG